MQKWPLGCDQMMGSLIVCQSILNLQDNIERGEFEQDKKPDLTIEIIIMIFQ